MPCSPDTSELADRLERNATDCERMDRWATPELAPLLREAAAAIRASIAQSMPSYQTIADYIYDETTKLDAPILMGSCLVMAKHILSSVASTPGERRALAIADERAKEACHLRAQLAKAEAEIAALKAVKK